MTWMAVKKVEIFQGGMAVNAWVHDCGSVCLYQRDYSGSYITFNLWCPTCEVNVEPIVDPDEDWDEED
jgi:hypothetical protein